MNFQNNEANELFKIAMLIELNITKMKKKVEKGEMSNEQLIAYSKLVFESSSEYKQLISSANENILEKESIKEVL